MSNLETQKQREKRSYGLTFNLLTVTSSLGLKCFFFPFGGFAETC